MGYRYHRTLLSQKEIAVFFNRVLPLRTPSATLLVTLMLMPAVHASVDRHIPLNTKPESDDNEPDSSRGSLYLSVEGWGERVSSREGDNREDTGSYLSAYLSTNLSDSITLNAAAEYDFNGETSFDEIYASWDSEGGDLSASFGKQYLPFGRYSTAMYTSPLTYSLGGILADQMASLSLSQNAVTVSAYAFAASGSNNNDGQRPPRLRLSVDYSDELKDLSISFLSNLGENFTDFGQVQDDIPAIALFNETKLGEWRLIGELISALKPFAPGDLDGTIETPIEPYATQLELQYHGRNSSVAGLSWSQTRDAGPLELLQRSVGMTLSHALHDSVTLTAEVLKNLDYDQVSETVFSVSVEIGHDVLF